MIEGQGLVGWTRLRLQVSEYSGRVQRHSEPWQSGFQRHPGQQCLSCSSDGGGRTTCETCVVRCKLAGFRPSRQFLAERIEQGDDEMRLFFVTPGIEPDRYDFVAHFEVPLDRLHQCGLTRAPVAEYANGELRFAVLDNFGKSRGVRRTSQARQGGR